jgi:Tfp pilus assembly PilM family ATPase
VARSDEITSTEKLLDVIRQKPEETIDEPERVETPKTPPQESKGSKTANMSGAKVIPKHKSVIVGVDIGGIDLRLVKVARSADRKWKLIDYNKVSLARLSSRQRPEFAEFLKSQINAFCGPRESFQLWVNMSAAQVSVQHLAIPKVKKEQIENTILWTLKREGSFDEREHILDFEVRGDVVEQGITKLSVMVSIAPRLDVEELKRLFVETGIPVAGISITPFAIQNIFRTHWLPTLEQTVANLFIGNDFSRIDIYSSGNLVMTRAIKAGLNSMVESCIEEYKEQTRSGKGGYEILDMAQARKIVFSLSQDSSALDEKDQGYGLSEKEIFAMIEPAVERLTRQAERTFEYYMTTSKNGRVDKVFVSSLMNVYRPLVDYVGTQLAIDTDVLDPLKDPITDLLSGSDAVTISDRAAFVPALGLALSDNSYTPNFLYTYADKEKVVRIAWLNRIIFIGFIIAVFLCSGVLVYQTQAAGQKRALIKNLEQQVAKFSPTLDQNLLLQMAAKANQQQQLAKTYGVRYLGMAVLSEITALTPENIRLLSLKATFPITSAPPSPTAPGPSSAAAPKQTKDAAKTQARTESITLEGLVTGDAKNFESDLASYVVKVDSSPLFEKTSLQKSSIETFKRGQVMYFIITTQLEAG